MEAWPGRPKVYLRNIENRTDRDRRQISRACRSRPASDGQRPADHEPAAGRQFQPVRDGSAVEIDHLTDPRRQSTPPSSAPDGSFAHLFRIRAAASRRPSDAGNRRTRRSASPLSKDDTNGSYSPRSGRRGRLHRLHQAGRRTVFHRHHEARWLRRSGSLTTGFHNEGPTRAERPRGDVLPRPRRQQRALAVHRGHFRTQRTKVPTSGFASDPAWSPCDPKSKDLR